MSTATQPSFTPEFAKTFTTLMTGKIEREHPTTKRVLAAVPNDKKNYKPHENSRSGWELAVHVAQSDVWFLNSIAEGAFNWAETPAPADDVKGLVAWYETEFPKAMSRVRGLRPEQLLKPVDFFGMMTAPVFLYLQFAQDHTVHHRGQLSTYLRPMGGKVPDIYGGSYDEPFNG